MFLALSSIAHFILTYQLSTLCHVEREVDIWTKVDLQMVMVKLTWLYFWIGVAKLRILWRGANGTRVLGW